MKVTFTDKFGAKVSYEDSPELHKKVFDYLIENFFKEYECYFGECIMQSDDPQINAPVVLSDVADDIIKFDVKYEDE